MNATPNTNDILAYEEMIARRTSYNIGDRPFDASNLDQRFVQFYNNGERIKVQYTHCDETFTGTVGVTTGWKPVFILIHSSRSMGSSIILNENFKIIGTKRRGEKRYHILATPL